MRRPRDGLATTRQKSKEENMFIRRVLEAKVNFVKYGITTCVRSIEYSKLVHFLLYHVYCINKLINAQSHLPCSK